MRDLEKWTRAHDDGGWRYEFQCSNMAESFNKLLLGIRGMPMNVIVQFTFYKLVAWFNDRHAHALQLRSDGSIGAVQRPTARFKSRGYMWLSSKISSALVVNQAIPLCMFAFGGSS